MNQGMVPTLKTVKKIGSNLMGLAAKNVPLIFVFNHIETK